jgi:xanthine/CO dehydrogenase XdhC/CoxF family maturation factor
LNLLALDIILNYSKILHLDMGNSSMVENSASRMQDWADRLAKTIGTDCAEGDNAQEKTEAATTGHRAEPKAIAPCSENILVLPRRNSPTLACTVSCQTGFGAQWKMFLIGENTREGSVLGS